MERTSVKLLIRDFVTDGLEEKERMLQALAETAVARHPGSRVDTVVEQSHRNMRQVLDQHPRSPNTPAKPHGVRDSKHVGARFAAARTARATFMALPCPNIFCRRTQLPFAARMGVGAGHGESRRGHRAPARAWGRARSELSATHPCVGYGDDHYPRASL